MEPLFGKAEIELLAQILLHSEQIRYISGTCLTLACASNCGASLIQLTRGIIPAYIKREQSLVNGVPSLRYREKRGKRREINMEMATTLEDACRPGARRLLVF